MGKNAWLDHLKSFWASNKGKMSYKQAMVAAKKTYRRVDSAKPKKKARRAKKK